MAIIVASSTSLPASTSAFAATATGCPSRAISRRMSPVEIFSRPRSRANRPAWVPFPAPGGPIMMTFRPIRFLAPSTGRTPKPCLSAPPADAGLLHEAVVVPHDELRFHLLNSVHRHTHHDQQRRATEIERHPHALGEPCRQHGIEP